MRLALALCCACAIARPREVEIITLQSVTMYDVWLWEQAGEYDEGYEYVGDDEPVELFGPTYYYPEDEQPDDDLSDLKTIH